MKFRSEVEEEKKGKAKYERMAKSNPKHSSKFLSMAKDEAKHGKMLATMKKMKSPKTHDLRYKKVHKDGIKADGSQIEKPDTGWSDGIGKSAKLNVGNKPFELKSKKKRKNISPKANLRNSDAPKILRTKKKSIKVKVKVKIKGNKEEKGEKDRG